MAARENAPILTFTTSNPSIRGVLHVLLEVFFYHPSVLQLGKWHIGSNTEGMTRTGNFLSRAFFKE